MASANFASVLSTLQATGQVVSKVEFRDETTLLIERAGIHAVCAQAKALGFTYLLDISGVDNFGEDPRFEVVYELYHFERGEWLRLKIKVSEDDLEVDSVADLWATADWHEREAFDMFGLRFRGHPDLRRILMWDGYPYFPLRKDFPLAGRPSEMPDVAFTGVAPLVGGPFVTSSTTATAKDREPRARPQE